MSVRNFFTKATSEYTGCFVFFNGSVLGTEASFRGHFEGSNDSFYVKIEENLVCDKPFIRAKYFPCHWGIFLLEVETYNPKSGLYELIELSDKDRKFIIHVLKTSYAVIIKAHKAWRAEVERMEDSEFESIPY